jgi:hypothetical protein
MPKYIIGKEPDSRASVKDLEAIERLKQYETMVKNYLHICEEYLEKLSKDLKKYEQIQDNGTTSYNEPTDKESLDYLAWKKYQIVNEAILELKNNSRNPQENIEACINHLKKSDNVTILSKRRDSWLMGAAKIAFSIGTISIYRYLMGNKVTQGIRNVSMFEEKYNKMQDASVNAPIESKASVEATSKNIEEVTATDSKRLSSDQFDQFCRKVTEMCEGLTYDARKMYDEKTSGGMDFILHMDSSIIAYV